MSEDLRWQRFVLDDDDDRGREEVELARRGTTVFVRTVRGDGEPRFEAHRLASEAAAFTSHERRVAALRKRGHLDDGFVKRPAPEVASKQQRAAAREQALADARSAFDRGLVAFVRAWRARGHDPCLSFLEQGKRPPRIHPRELAQECLTLAAACCGVAFTRRTATYDAEHGAVLAIPPRLLAEFYVGPASVLAIAYCKLRGRCGRTDDVDLPGLADELAARMRAVAE